MYIEMWSTLLLPPSACCCCSSLPPPKVAYRLKACPALLNCYYKWYCQINCVLVNAMEPQVWPWPGTSVLRSLHSPTHHGSLPPCRHFIDLAACHACCQLLSCVLSSGPTLVSEKATEEWSARWCRGGGGRQASCSDFEFVYGNAVHQSGK